MIQKRLRQKMFRVWLNEKEHKFLSQYANKNLLTASELFRGWLHEVMKREGYELREPLLPESTGRKK